MKTIALSDAQVQLLVGLLTRIENEIGKDLDELVDVFTEDSSNVLSDYFNNCVDILSKLKAAPAPETTSNDKPTAA